MLCWSHTATSNTSSGSEPIGNVVALHLSQQLKDVEDRWSIGDYQDLPFRLCGMFIIVIDAQSARHIGDWSGKHVCVHVFGERCLWVPASCVCARSSVHACYKGIECVTALHHWSGWEQVGERLREIREAVIRECFLCVSLLKNRAAEGVLLLWPGKTTWH